MVVWRGEVPCRGSARICLRLIAFDGDAGKTAESVGHVGVGQTADDVGGENLNNVVGGALAIDGFDFGRAAFRNDLTWMSTAPERAQRQGS